MDITGLSYNSVILSDILPISEFKLTDKYTLRVVRASPEMFEGFLPEAKQKYNVLLAIPHLDDYSFDTYRDLVVFHGFITNNHDTYEFAENTPKTQFLDSELVFIKHVKEKDAPRLITSDFNSFPVYRYDSQDSLNSAHPTCELVNYGEAFQLFAGLKQGNETRKLYNQIQLFAFARSFTSINRIYQNTNMPISFYITVLESIIGEPPICNNKLRCPACGVELVQHYKKSLERHFRDQYPMLSHKARSIRHSTYHEGQYFDFISSFIQSILDRGQGNQQSGKRMAQDEEITAELDFQVQKKLTNSFLNLL